jgi:hypothetical protein
MTADSDAFTIVIVCAIICVIISGILGLVWLLKTKHSHPLGTQVKRFIGLNTIESFVTSLLVAATIMLSLSYAKNLSDVAFFLIPTILIALGLILAPLSSLHWEHPTYQRFSLQIMIIGLIRIALAVTVFLALTASEGFGLIIAIQIVVTIISWFVFAAIQRKIQLFDSTKN